MSSELQVFRFEGAETRIVEGADGEPWWVASDVCRILDISNSRDALSRLDEDEKDVGSTDTPGGPQSMAVISEAGLYTLIMGSRKPDARRFRRWVTHEVLPALRRSGRYEMSNGPTEPSAPATFVPKDRYAALSSEVAGAIEIARLLGFEGNQVILSACKAIRSSYGVDFAEKFQLSLPAPHNEKTLTPTEIGERMGDISARKINIMLMDAGMQVKDGDAWRPTEKGKSFGEYSDAVRKNNTGPVKWWKWYEHIIDVIDSKPEILAIG